MIDMDTTSRLGLGAMLLVSFVTFLSLVHLPDFLEMIYFVSFMCRYILFIGGNRKSNDQPHS